MSYVYNEFRIPPPQQFPSSSTSGVLALRARQCAAKQGGACSGSFRLRRQTQIEGQPITFQAYGNYRLNLGSMGRVAAVRRGAMGAPVTRTKARSEMTRRHAELSGLGAPVNRTAARSAMTRRQTMGDAESIISSIIAAGSQITQAVLLRPKVPPQTYYVPPTSYFAQPQAVAQPPVTVAPAAPGTTLGIPSSYLMIGGLGLGALLLVTALNKR